MQNQEWYDDSPMFPNVFQKLAHDLEQVKSSTDNYIGKYLNLLSHQEELERITF